LNNYSNSKSIVLTALNSPIKIPAPVSSTGTQNNRRASPPTLIFEFKVYVAIMNPDGKSFELVFLGRESERFVPLKLTVTHAAHPPASKWREERAEAGEIT